MCVWCVCCSVCGVYVWCVYSCGGVWYICVYSVCIYVLWYMYVVCVCGVCCIVCSVYGVCGACGVCGVYLCVVCVVCMCGVCVYDCVWVWVHASVVCTHRGGHEAFSSVPSHHTLWRQALSLTLEVDCLLAGPVTLLSLLLL